MSPRGLLPPLFGLPWERSQEPLAEDKATEPVPPAAKPSALGPRSEVAAGLTDENTLIPSWARKSRAYDSETARHGAAWVSTTRKLQKFKDELDAVWYGANNVAVRGDRSMKVFLDEALGRSVEPYREGYMVTAEEAAWLGIKKPKPYVEAAAKPPSPIAAEAPVATPPAEPDDLVIVMSRRRPNPVWLDGYKKRLAEASRVAAERTQHLKGAERVRAMNQIVRDRMRADHGPAA